MMKRNSQKNKTTKASVKHQTQKQGNVASPLQLQDFHEFVGTFINLWYSGCKANLHISCDVGSASVNLNVGMGHYLSPSHSQPEFHQPHPSPYHHKVSPSRLRRRERRDIARKEAAKNVALNPEAEKFSPNAEFNPAVPLHKVHRQREPEIAAPTEAEEATFSHKVISSQLYHKQRQDKTTQEEKADVSRRVNHLGEVDIDDPPKKINERHLAPVNYKKMFHPK